ncbi:MAG TPA: threonine ammonia-lyase IlvA [Candidatus Saccharimonadales bacterium]|nr:threonine ammonia-lyase IlvA [Candidatus Saccharimonadales bacterium]
MNKVTVQSIDEAAKTLEKVVKKTPLQFNKRLSDLYQANVYIKREDLQDVRSFKIRGAYNKIASLSSKQKEHGVVTASTGNHAQGVAYSCFLLKIKGTIFMPTVIPNQKIEKVKHFGGKFIEIKLVGNTFDDAVEASLDYCKEINANYVHPFDDPVTISGQGTTGKEIYEKLAGEVDVIISPIGGGGLISGISTYVKTKNKKIKVFGVEAEGAASMEQSLRTKKIVPLGIFDTFVDGAAVNKVGNYAFEICSTLVEKVCIAKVGKICSTMIDLYQQEGIIAEPAGALSISVLDDLKSEIIGKTVVCVLSGGNNDILRYPEIMEKSLVYKGLKHYFLVEFAQKPGQLKAFLNHALGPSDDIVLFEYIKKNSREKGPALIGIELTKKEDLTPLLDKMDKLQIRYTKIDSDDPLYGFVL